MTAAMKVDSVMRTMFMQKYAPETQHSLNHVHTLPAKFNYLSLVP